MKHLLTQWPMMLLSRVVVLMALPGGAEATTATAFNSGSGANITYMRSVILTVGVSLAVMLCAAVIVNLLNLHQIESAEGQQTILWYSVRFAILLALLIGVFWYL